jgi:branched-subunit amino acid transport protein
MTAWIVVIVVGLATFAMRFLFIALFGRIAVPRWLERSLAYVAPSVLAAITVPAVVAPGGTYELWNPFIPAVIVGGIAAWLSRSIGGAILAGLVALWIIQWVA